MSIKWINAMHTFTDRIKEGILANDMTLIAEALREFTEEELVEATVEDINAPSKSTEKDPEDFTMPVSDDDIETARQRLTKRKSLELMDRENKFTDDGTITIDEVGAELINDTAVQPVTRSRKPASEPVSITCHVCGKTELVHPSLKKEHHRCDSCCKG